jgi:hypothetical protein
MAFSQGRGISSSGRGDQIGAGSTARDVTLYAASSDVIEAPVDEGQNRVFIETVHAQRRVSDRPRCVFSLVEPP